jgi:MYXO-CTERM domain-containing protein
LSSKGAADAAGWLAALGLLAFAMRRKS